MSDTKAEPLRFRNWERFQHYRDRRPPWIKLHRTLIDDADFHGLSDAAGKYLPMAWIVASEQEQPGSLPCVKTLAFRLRITEAVCVALLREWLPYLEHGASTALAGCVQDACLETEREGEAEAEGETDPHTPVGGEGAAFHAFWAAYPRKVGRKAALKAWQKAKDRPPIAAVLDAIAWQRTTEQWRKDGGQYIPMPATWLNQGRWADERGAPVARPQDWRSQPSEPIPPQFQRSLS
jgi:hypothetical protein